MTQSPNTQTFRPANIPTTAGYSVEQSAADSHKLALTTAQAADARKAADIVLLKVTEVSYLADYFLIATGFSHVQVRAIANSIEQTVEETYNRLPIHREGHKDGSWVLLDYGEVIVHIFSQKEREFYNLEAFWGHAERIAFTALPTYSGKQSI